MPKYHNKYDVSIKFVHVLIAYRYVQFLSNLLEQSPHLQILIIELKKKKLQLRITLDDAGHYSLRVADEKKI